MHNQVVVSMYRWLSREFTTVEYHTNESSLGKIGYEETVTTNREIVANHLVYTHLYIFLVAEVNRLTFIIIIHLDFFCIF